MHMPFGKQLVYDPLINMYSNNHHLISRCCQGNKQKFQDGRRIFDFWDFA